MKAKFNENGKLIVDALGRTKFDFIYQYDDGSTETKKDNIYILTEQNGTLFKDNKGRTEFDSILRYNDGTTETIKDGETIITKKQ